ncbi:hypothetical protein [Natrialba sp. SSL1]|uniref:hypothetical protein n=1 Tax=Natrialba sp. SSL1 TaxID=1869245 RepID=UPI00373FE190
MKTAVSDQQRYDALAELAASDDRTALGVIVRTGGLRGEFRRQALEYLADCHATTELESLAEETTIERSLRRRAAVLA